MTSPPRCAFHQNVSARRVPAASAILWDSSEHGNSRQFFYSLGRDRHVSSDGPSVTITPKKKGRCQQSISIIIKARSMWQQVEI